MNKTISLLLSLLMVITVIVSCSSNKNQVNKFLDSYEKIVVKWEEKAEKDSFSDKDLDELDEIMEKTTSEAKDLQNVTEWTSKQQKRYGELTERLMKSIFQSVNIFE